MSIKTYSYKKNKNKKLTAHFTVGEFVSNVAGKITYDAIKIDTNLISKLEKFFDYDIDSIAITSGYRHPNDSVAVGGSATDAHTKGLAADIICYRDGKTVPSKEVSCIAQLIGFSGIGIISNTSVHVDVRTTKNYSNGHWWGDERNGNNYISDFFQYNQVNKALLLGKVKNYDNKCFKIKATKKTPIRIKPDDDAKLKKYYEKGKTAWVYAEKDGFYKVKSGWIKKKDVNKI